MTIVTPGRMAPDASLTLPFIVPVVAVTDCADAVAVNATSKHAPNANRIPLIGRLHQDKAVTADETQFADETWL
jgi:hypothetical protein